jgi:hypothetical protein
MKAINLGVLTLVHLAGPALAATCYRPNAAGGEIPYECVRGEELKADAPGLPEWFPIRRPSMRSRPRRRSLLCRRGRWSGEGRVVDSEASTTRHPGAGRDDVERGQPMPNHHRHSRGGGNLGHRAKSPTAVAFAEA